MLTLSRIEAQAILTDTAPFPLAEQLRQAALLVEQKWKHTKNVVIETAIPEDNECTYTGSEELLKEVWVNLLDNAVKFSPCGLRGNLIPANCPGCRFRYRHRPWAWYRQGHPGAYL